MGRFTESFLYGQAKMGYEDSTGTYLGIKDEDTFSLHVSDAEIKKYEAEFQATGKKYTIPNNERAETVRNEFKANFDKVEARQLGYSTAYSEHISEASSEYNISPMLIRSVIQAESSGNPRAKSSVGAVGLMQIMEKGALAEVNQKYETEYTIEDMTNPQKNIEVGTAYLKILLDKFGGNEKFALAAYNAGPTKVNNLIGDQSDATYENIATNLPEETQNYVAKVSGYQDSYQRIQELTQNNPKGTVEWKDTHNALVATGIIKLSSSAKGSGETGKSRESNRTCIDGLRGATIEGMRLLSEKLGGKTQVCTGGTEVGHSNGEYSHEN